MVEELIQNTKDLNTVARHLRDRQEFDRIRKLAYEWLVPDGYVDEFISGKRVLLADVDIEEKEYRSASEKLADEMHLIGDSDYADVVGLYICRKCADKEYESRVMQQHKALQKCLDYVLKKAYKVAEERLGENGMRKRDGVGTALISTKVFAWVDEYYALDDAKEEAEKKEKAMREFIEKRKKAEESAKKRKKEDEERKERQAKKNRIAESKKKAEESQMSIFDLMQDSEQREGNDATASAVKEEQNLDQSEPSGKTDESGTETQQGNRTEEFD